LGKVQQLISIAISGGQTPELFFKHLAAGKGITGELPDWNKIHLFWVDERCVPPDHPDSNFGFTAKHLLEKITIPHGNIHRIKGENDPSIEAGRYSDEIHRYTTLGDGIPVFDWIFLGIGSDGHTASIFPDRLDLMNSVNTCEAVKHPSSGQDRITLTGRTIINANRITFMVTGKSKSKVIRQILEGEPGTEKLPAGLITKFAVNSEFYLDEEAAFHIKSTCHGKH
jgi:6-phosphogluconolactonase